MQNQKGNTSLIISFIIVIAFVGLIIYTLANPKPKSALQNIEEQENKQEQLTELTQNNNMEQNTNVERVSKNGDVLIMNYTGRLTNGTVFDSNIDPKFNHVQPFEFTLGAGQVIKGWDEGLVGMKVGEKKTLTIAPEKAYGSRAIGSIPANSTLIFDVELVGIK